MRWNQRCAVVGHIHLESANGYADGCRRCCGKRVGGTYFLPVGTIHHTNDAATTCQYLTASRVQNQSKQTQTYRDPSSPNRHRNHYTHHLRALLEMPDANKVLYINSIFSKAVYLCPQHTQHQQRNYGMSTTLRILQVTVTRFFIPNFIVQRYI